MLCPDVTNIDIVSDAMLNSHSTNNSMSTYCKNNLSLNDFINEKISEQQHILTVVPIDKEAPSSDK